MARVMIACVCDTFIVGDGKARAAADGLAHFNGLKRRIAAVAARIGTVDTKRSWMKWCSGASTALVAGVLVERFLQ